MNPVRLTVKRPLARKLLWLIAPPILLILVSIQFAGYLTLKRKIIEGIDQQLNLMSVENSSVIANLFRHYANDLETLSEISLIADYYKNRDYRLYEEAEAYRRELGNYFLDFSKRAKIYARICYLSAEGGGICSPEGPRGKARSAAPEPLFAHLRRRPHEIYRSALQPGPDGRKDRIMRYAKAILDPLGKLKGALVLDCDVGAIERTLAEIRIGRSGGAYLIDPNDHRVIINPRLAEFDLKVARSVRGTAWKIVLAADKGEFLKPLDRIQRASALTALACILLLLAAIFSGIRAGMAPLGRLLLGIKRISGGDLDQDIPAHGEDEIAAVTRAFNQMAQNLKRGKTALQAKIDQLLAFQTLSEAIISRMDEAQILKTCLGAALHGLRFDRGTLYWIDKEKRELAGSCASGIEELSEEEMRARRIPLSGGDILAHVARANEPVYVADPLRDPRCNPAYVQQTKTRAFCAVPIRGKQSVLGVIAVDNYYSNRPILNEDIQSLLMFANSAGIALENMALLHKIAQDEIRRRMILDNAVEAILSLDSSFRITTWNRGAQSLFGYQESEALGKPVAFLFPEKAGLDLAVHVIARGWARNYEIEGAAKGGRRLELHLTLAGAELEASKNKEWALVIRDVTEEKKLQTQLIESEKLSAIGQLISGIAHEISNPLAAVVGYSQMSALDNPPLRLREDLRLIQENAERCKKIIDNLLLFARHGTSRRGPVDVREAIENVRPLMQYRLEKKDAIRVVEEFDPRARPILGDMQQIEQVFINILNNACDALGSARGQKSIHVRSRQEGERLRIEIEDNGPGMAADILEKIFDPFFTTKPPGKGTGLGLAITRQIIRDHGGDISCRSRPGKGTAFLIELPTMAAERRVFAPRPAVLPACPGKRVLIVDDERSMARLILKLVRQDGSHAEAAYDGAKALKMLSHRSYDLIIADMALGGVQGEKILEYWDRRLRSRGTQALAITGDVLNHSLAELFKKYRVAHLTKPFDLGLLRQKVRELLSGASRVPVPR